MPSYPCGVCLKSCAKTELGVWGQFDYDAALKRVSTAVDSKSVSKLRACVESELLLLETYCVNMPPITSCTAKGARDHVATAILKKFHPLILTEYKPLEVEGDGNCLYRASSRAFLGSKGCTNIFAF